MKNRISFLITNALFLLLFATANAQHYGAPGQQTPVLRDAAKGIPYGYYEYLPQNYDTSSVTTKKYPVVLFFGGVGELGNGTTQLSKLLNPDAPPKIIKEGRHFPAIVISAQHSGWFDEKQSKELYDYVTKHYPVDSSRVYVTGLSAGGAATWKFGNAYPHLAAAIVPVAGATNFKSPVPHMQEMSIWAFHNVGDGWTGGGVPSVWTMINGDMIANIPASSRSVYPGGWAFLKSAGFDVTIHFKDSSRWESTNGVVMPHQKMALTIYDKLGHGGWSTVYRSNYMWNWLFAQHKKTKDSVVVDAGVDQQLILPTAQTTFNGSAYSLIGTAISNYLWIKESGPTVSMSGVNTSSLTVSNALPGNYLFKLTATDANGTVASDKVELVVKAKPTADAGQDIQINLPQDSSQLDGSASADVDGHIQLYEWKLIKTELAVATADTDTIVIPGGDSTAFKVFINFTPSWYQAATPWNNTNGSISSGMVMTNLLDSNGNGTNIDLELMSSWNGSKLGGATTGNNTGVFPDDVINGVYWFQNKTPQLKISGLDQNKTYHFTFFGSRTGKGLDKTTVYQIGNEKDSIDAAENTTAVAVLENIQANANGEVMVDIRRGVNSSYGYLNAMVIEAAANSTAGSTTIVITNHPPASTVATDSTEMFVNFTPSYLKADPPWNNTNGSIAAGTQLLNLNDKRGRPTKVSLTLLSYWDGSKTGGKVTGNNGGIFPDDVMDGFYWFKGKTPQIKVSGLDPEMSYDFTFLASRAGAWTNKTTVYRIGNQTDSVNATENNSHVAELRDVKSNSAGEIFIDVAQGAIADYGYLNAMVIKGKTAALPVVIHNPNDPSTKVSGLQEGCFTFELTVTDNDGFLGKDTINLFVGPPIALKGKPLTVLEKAEVKETMLKMYPNPTTGILNIEWDKTEGPFQVNVFNPLGQQFAVAASHNSTKTTINLTHLPSGFYLVQVTDGATSKAERVYVAPQ
jgi:hypothetical protein